jgi:hypothetical protein
MNIVKIAYAATKDWNNGRCVSPEGVATLQGFECLFYNILQVITFFAGLVFFFMFINGAFKYIFAGGDQKKLAAANAAITMSFFSIIGVVVSVLILNLLDRFTGVSITKFIIPGGNPGTP